MGWAFCGTNKSTGQEMGYGVEGACSWPGCETQIDHGLSYLCGEMHEDGIGCNEYFCSEHRTFPVRDEDRGQRCLHCYALELMLYWDELDEEAAE